MSRLNTCAHCGASLAEMPRTTYQIRTHEETKHSIATGLVGYYCSWECISLYAIRRNAMEKTVRTQPDELPSAGDHCHK